MADRWVEEGKQLVQKWLEDRSCTPQQKVERLERLREAVNDEVDEALDALREELG